MTRKKIAKFAFFLLFGPCSAFAQSANDPQPTTGTSFVFCSLKDNNGCGMAAVAADPTPQGRAGLLWGTTHTEQGLGTLSQLWIATIGTNIAYTNVGYPFDIKRNSDPAKNKSPLSKKETYLNTNWNQENYLAGESDGSKIPYIKIGEQSIEIKVDIPEHGRELTPYFYVKYDFPTIIKYRITGIEFGPPIKAKVCLKDVTSVCPTPSTTQSNCREIQAFYTTNSNIDPNKRTDLKSIDDIRTSLKTIGLTDENFVGESDPFCG